jgi:acyl-CoA synthetase (NDP forming)
MNYDQAAVRKVLDQVQSEGRTALSAPEGKTLCAAYGISTPRQGIAHSPQEAAGLAEEMGYPVVLKVESGDILHKTEAGGVVTGLTNAADVEAAYTGIMDSGKSFKTGSEPSKRRSLPSRRTWRRREPPLNHSN